jgi:mutual gliding-motility protein MglA
VVVVSYSGKEINAKLVYYGAGLSGKTTNLEAIYEAVPDTSRGKMVSMKTQSDRTLFFDLLPLDLGEIMGFKTRFLLYTVPGQVFYNATRKLVLKGADAIVFVADSEVGKMEENKESLENLRANLAEYKLSLDDIPWVIQYNKRDLPNLYTCDELNAALNATTKVPYFEAVATQGKGVFETFRGISHLLMEKVTKDLRRSPTSSAPREASRLEDAVPRRISTPAAPPPMAPGRAIEREAQQTAPAINGPSESLDYGRQIELPDETPVERATSTPAPREPQPPPRAPQPSAPSPMMSAVAAAAARSAPEISRPSAGRPQTFAPLAPATMAPAAPAAPTAPAQASAPARSAAGAPERAAADASQPAAIVVPVTLPANGQGRELVIRIVFSTPAE